MVLNVNLLLLCLNLIGLLIAHPLDKLSGTKLNVHVAPHSHDDPGWLKTADQYYSGNNASIYPAQVQYIFDSVVAELQKSDDKTFVFCEISFFERWWNEQEFKTKTIVRELLKNGQLSFVNGGWVMHDEASAHYVSMVDQTTLGHQFLLKELNYRPRVGWQIDPFGHSSTHAWLSNEVGFDGLFFGRIDYQDRAKRKADKAMEFVWSPSSSQPDAAVFSGAFSDGNYGAPPGLCFDTTCSYCRDDPAVDDAALSSYNIDQKVQSLVQYIQGEAAITRGNNVMVKLGADFTADNVRTWYKSMDKVMAAVNSMPNSPYNVFYSDPTTYMRAKAMETDVNWPAKGDDFFPYSDSEHAFWAGYFTSRPTLKYLERQSSSYLQVLKQLTAQHVQQKSHTTALSPSLLTLHDSIFRLTAGVGLINHHDAITGTAKQHVTDDYKKILASALTKAEEVASSVVDRMHARHMHGALSSSSQGPKFGVCRMSNETTCAATQQLVVGDAVVLAVYNPLPRRTTGGSSIELYMSDLFSDNDDIAVMVIQLDGIEDASGNATTARTLKRVSSSLIPTATVSNPPTASRAPWTLVINTAEAEIPAMGMAYYWVEVVDRSSSQAPLMSHDVGTAVYASKAVKVERSVSHAAVGDGAGAGSTLGSMTVHQTPSILRISNCLVTVSFDRTSGLMSSVTRHDSNNGDITIDIKNDLAFYRSFGTVSTGYDATAHVAADTRDPHLKNRVPNPSVAAQEGQPSGAYIFRPSMSEETPTRVCGTPADNNDSATTSAASSDGSSCVVELSAVTHSTEVIEIVQHFSTWANQVVRLRAGALEVELEYIVGAIPIADDVGKEIITKFDSNMRTGGKGQNVVYTDSNGREFMQRKFNYRPTWDLDVYEPVSGNYYPTSAAMYIRDEDAGTQLSLLTDRSLGGASLSDGSMEMMINRRLLVDDNRGVGEPLNETTLGMTHYPSFTREGDGIIATGKNYLILSAADSAMRDVRGAMDRVFLPPAVFISDDAEHAEFMVKQRAQQQARRAEFSGLGAELPLNVHLMSLETLDSGEALLLRLAHQFAVGEDEVYSMPATVDVGKLLAPYKPVSMVELTLSANENKATQLANKIRWKGSTATAAAAAARAGNKNSNEDAELVVTLNPMQIRTFKVQVQQPTTL